MRKTTPKQQIWTVNLSMSLGTEQTTVKHDIDLGGDARDVIKALYDAKAEVVQAVEAAVLSIMQSAQGFGLKRGQ